MPTQLKTAAHSVVVAGLDKHDPVAAHQINESMLLCDPTRPVVCTTMLQRLGLADALKGIPTGVLDQLDDAQRRARLGANPIGEIGKHLFVEDDEARGGHPAAGTGQPASTQARNASGEMTTPSPRSARSIASNSRRALARDASRWTVSCRLRSSAASIRATSGRPRRWMNTVSASPVTRSNKLA